MTICRHCKQYITSHSYGFADDWYTDETRNIGFVIPDGECQGEESYGVCSARGAECGGHEPMTETEIVEQLLNEYDREI